MLEKAGVPVEYWRGLHVKQQEDMEADGQWLPELMIWYIELQFFLCALTVDDIRWDFIEYRIIELDDAELVLFTLDRMRELLIPMCHSSSYIRNLMTVRVINYMKALVAKEKGMFIIPSPTLVVEQSYSEWKDILQQLTTTSKYGESLLLLGNRGSGESCLSKGSNRPRKRNEKCLFKECSL